MKFATTDEVIRRSAAFKMLLCNNNVPEQVILQAQKDGASALIKNAAQVSVDVGK
jgi:hypothetical protein